MTTTTEYTWLCDSATCEHETTVRHERGAGVFCDECSERRIRLSFEPETETEHQDLAIEEAMRTVPQTGL